MRNLLLLLGLSFSTLGFAVTTIVGGALPPCANNAYVLTYSTTTGAYSCAAAAGGGITWATAVDNSIIPATNSLYDLGNATHEFEDFFIENVVRGVTDSFICVSGDPSCADGANLLMYGSTAGGSKAYDWYLRAATGNSLSFDYSSNLIATGSGTDFQVDDKLDVYGFATFHGPRLGFYDTTAVVQHAAVPDATGGAIIDAECRAATNGALDVLRDVGLVAP